MKPTAVDFSYMQNTVWRLKAKHPAIRVKQIGKSVVGRSIYSLELGRETAPGVLFLGTFLGTDRVSGRLLLGWLDHLATAIEEGASVAEVDPLQMLCDRKIVIIPFVNPDGREICQRGCHCAGVDGGKIRRLCGGHTAQWAANARGVDITANFDFRFTARRKRAGEHGVFGPSMKGYTGPFPESEPETVAVVEFCKHTKLRYGITLYPGNGQILWRTRTEQNRQAEKMAGLLALVGEYDTEASLGCMVDTGFRNWFTTTMQKPALDIMFTATADEVLEEMLTVACLF